MTGFSDADFDDGCVMDELKPAVSSRTAAKMVICSKTRCRRVARLRLWNVPRSHPKKTGRWKGRNHWTTTEQWEVDPEDDLPREQIQEFAAAAARSSNMAILTSGANLPQLPNSRVTELLGVLLAVRYFQK